PIIAFHQFTPVVCPSTAFRITHHGKAGIFLVARLSLSLTGSTMFFMLVSGVGIITLCWASYIAVRQPDLKASYSCLFHGQSTRYDHSDARLWNTCSRLCGTFSYFKSRSL